MQARTPLALAVGVWCLTFGLAPISGGGQPETAARGSQAQEIFQPSSACVACHNGLTTPAGEDVSIGVSWRSSMMANSGRDPYWLASVRRETLDHPGLQDDIEDECSTCHMPMARAAAVAAGRKGEIFAHVGRGAGPASGLAADGVSCTLCHQISADRLGTADSFTGRFALRAPEGGDRQMLGPYDVSQGHTTIMQTASGVRPAPAAHIRSADLCATCHTLITRAFGADGRVIGRLPEQVPYLEWQHSALWREKTCQQCHMPTVEQPTAVTSVFGEPRDSMGRHTFIGGNFFMLRLLNRYRMDLAVQALPQELESSALATIRQLQNDTARVNIERAEAPPGMLAVDVTVTNLTGHKLPTGYPARRAWLHVTIRAATGDTVFESGAVTPDGAIVGNDNDADAARFEPHYDVIRRADEVQIYESVMGDSSGAPTTGLLSAVRFLKDNRLLPRGFDKHTTSDDIAVRGGALDDANFNGDGDHLRLEVPADRAGAPFAIDVELRYQPIAYRWAHNLSRYNAPEPRRFVSYYRDTSAASSVVIARATTRVP